LTRTPIDLIRNLGQQYIQGGDAKEVQGFLQTYSRQIGSDLPVIELVVASAIARGDIVTAEMRSADCLGYENGSRYPLCAAALGYDPTSPGVEARTPEGKRAFQNAKGLPEIFNKWGSIFK
jgi:hypothetical protein